MAGEEIKKDEVALEAQVSEVSEKETNEVVAEANKDADAPKKNAVAAEPSKLSNEAEDLGPAVTKPTDSNPDGSKNIKKVKDKVNAQANDVDAAGKPDTEAGVTKVSHPADTKKESFEDRVKSLDVSDDVKALTDSDESLSEEFKDKAKVVFEAAIKSKLKEEVARIETESAEQLETAKEEYKKELSEKVDSYLSYVVEEWMKENELAIEKGIKGEIAEDFISGLKKLFEEHYIDVPDEKYNVLEDQAQKIDELEKKLNESIEKNVQSKKQIDELKQKDVFAEVAKDLADTEKEKFNSLAESVEYADEESYKEKLSKIKESYFPRKETLSEIDDVAAGEEPNYEVSGAMAAYTAAISKTKKYDIYNNNGNEVMVEEKVSK